MIIKNKRGGADLLLELVLSAVIFFVIVFFLFGLNIPQLELKACAKVVSADAALGCETSVNNLLKSYSPDGTKYSDWLLNSWQKNDTKLWSGNVSNIMNDVFGAGSWELDVFLPNGTQVIPTLGKINTNQVGCGYTVPFTYSMLKQACGYNESKDSLGGGLTFDTPDGAVAFTIIDDGQLGAECASDNCKLDLEPKTIFEERAQNKVPNTPGLPDAIFLPVLISGSPYELSVEEKSDIEVRELPGVTVVLNRRNTLQDCGLTVLLKTTNVTEEVNTCRGKQFTRLGI